ncbi:MAG TPA: hypothetical protein VFP17_01825 [Solirubrobacterales bacterium]|nr:hypothetical protein [Solirubrobacterales bacterium]
MSSNGLTIVVAAFGATTGAVSLIAQWWTNRFKLVFERVLLRYEPDAVEQLRDQSAQGLNDSFFEFEVEIELLNLASGRGSIEKPRLEIWLPDGSTIVEEPQTREWKSEDLPGGFMGRRVWIERWGNSYSIAPRERLDDALSYMIDFKDGERLRAFLQSFEQLKFSLLYRDHRGREQREPIAELRGVEELI